MSKSAGSVSIIDGSDGPTSVFLAGSKHRDKNLLKRIKHIITIKKHQHQLKKARRLIKPGAHTLDETIRYMKERYGMTEVGSTDSFYEEARRRMDFSLVQRERIDLLPKRPEIKNFHDVDAVNKWHKELDKWEKQAEAIVEKLSQEVLNMDYHMFVLDKGEAGFIQVEIEINRGLIEVQYCGKGMDLILKDIYLYYGVSREDIANKTERYQSLVSVLGCV